MKFALVVSDLDGSLLNRKGKLTEFTRKTILDLTERGVQFATASARTISNTKDVLGSVYRKCCAIICVNGSYVLSAEEDVLGDYPLNDKEKADVLNVCEDIGASYCGISYDDAVAVVNHAKCGTVFGAYHRSYHRVGDPHSFSFPCHMIAAYAENMAPLKRYIEDHTSYLVSSPIYKSTFTGLDRLFIQSHGADKGTALATVAAHLKIPVKQTLALGDELSNDGPMLQAAGYAVAMKNAKGSMRDIAGAVTEQDNDQDGAARFLQDFFDLS